MRKFVISDLHGCGDIYDSVIAYLENLSLTELEPVHLYINGDLIDRGIDSYRMLMDVIKRCRENSNLVIHYMAGNHEQLMYRACVHKLKNGHFPFGTWDFNNNFDTKEGLSKLSQEELDDVASFIGGLDIYKKFDERVKGNNVLLVHAAAPRVVLDTCELKLSSRVEIANAALWSRVNENGCSRLGKDGYITIVGHSMNKGKYGFEYDPKDRVLNIDGGCATYATGFFDKRYVPLVEIIPGKLEILVFNHDNEIVKGFTLKSELEEMRESSLDHRRVFLEPNLNGCGEDYRRRVEDKNNTRISVNLDIDIDIPIDETPEEDDSDMKIYRKEDFTKK